MCRLCQHWRAVSLQWGDCRCPAMRFDFVPYSQAPDHPAPHPLPLADAGYNCENFSIAQLV